MRLAHALVLFFVLALCTSPAFAFKDDTKLDEPEWHFDLSGMRAIIAEVEPNDGCATAQPMACGDVINPARIDVAGDNDYYSFQGTAGIPITAGTDASDLCDPDAGDTYIYLLDQNCAQLAADDDGGPGLYSLISNYTPTYTGTFYVRVRHYSTSGTGCYKMFVNCAPPATGACCLAGGVCQVLTQAQCGTSGGTYQGDNTTCDPNPCPQPPPNDTCAGALVMDRCGAGTFTGTLAAAVNDYSPTNGCTGYAANGKDVAYVATMLAGDILHLVYTTPNHDGSLYVLSDCADMASCVVGEDDPEPETINWTVTADGTYYIIADAYTTNGGLDFTLDWSITCPPPVGACCFPDGSCQTLAGADCDAQGGIWYGPSVGCDPNPCPQPEAACCFPDGHCEFLTEVRCLEAGGVWIAGVLCDPNPCEQPPMACCFPDGHCEFILEVDCIAMGGVPQGFGTSCDPNLCPQPLMACCFPNGDCTFVTAEDCTLAGGVPQGLGTDCEPNLCPQPPAQGACCIGDQGDCRFVTEAECMDLGGEYQGDDIPCEPNNPCPIVPTQDATWGQIKANYR